LSSSRKPEGKGEIAGIQQRQRTDFRSVAFDPFRLAARRAELRGVDIRDADFSPWNQNLSPSTTQSTFRSAPHNENAADSESAVGVLAITKRPERLPEPP
jgi:hypothetical protein